VLRWCVFLQKASNSMQADNNKAGKEVILRSVAHVVNPFYSLRLTFPSIFYSSSFCFFFICRILGRDPGLKSWRARRTNSSDTAKKFPLLNLWNTTMRCIIERNGCLRNHCRQLHGNIGAASACKQGAACDWLLCWNKSAMKTLNKVLTKWRVCLHITETVVGTTMPRWLRH
jgi:hypothetical protein